MLHKNFSLPSSNGKLFKNSRQHWNTLSNREKDSINFESVHQMSYDVHSFWKCSFMWEFSQWEANCSLSLFIWEWTESSSIKILNYYLLSIPKLPSYLFIIIWIIDFDTWQLRPSMIQDVSRFWILILHFIIQKIPHIHYNQGTCTCIERNYTMNSKEFTLRKDTIVSNSLSNWV